MASPLLLTSFIDAKEIFYLDTYWQAIANGPQVHIYKEIDGSYQFYQTLVLENSFRNLNPDISFLVWERDEDHSLIVCWGGIEWAAFDFDEERALWDVNYQWQTHIGPIQQAVLASSRAEEILHSKWLIGATEDTLLVWKMIGKGDGSIDYCRAYSLRDGNLLQDPLSITPSTKERKIKLEISSSQKYLVTSGMHHDRIAKVWLIQDFTAGCLPCQYLPHSSAIQEIQFSNDHGQEDLLICLDKRGTISLWMATSINESYSFSLIVQLTADGLDLNETFCQAGFIRCEKSHCLSDSKHPFGEYSIQSIDQAMSLFSATQRNEKHNVSETYDALDRYAQRDLAATKRGYRIGTRYGMLADSHAGEQTLPSCNSQSLEYHSIYAVGSSGTLVIWRVDCPVQLRAAPSVCVVSSAVQASKDLNDCLLINVRATSSIFDADANKFLTTCSLISKDSSLLTRATIEFCRDNLNASCGSVTGYMNMMTLDQTYAVNSIQGSNSRIEKLVTKNGTAAVVKSSGKVCLFSVKVSSSPRPNETPSAFDQFDVDRKISLLSIQGPGNVLVSYTDGGLDSLVHGGTVVEILSPDKLSLLNSLDAYYDEKLDNHCFVALLDFKILRVIAYKRDNPLEYYTDCSVSHTGYREISCVPSKCIASVESAELTYVALSEDCAEVWNINWTNSGSGTSLATMKISLSFKISLKKKFLFCLAVCPLTSCIAYHTTPSKIALINLDKLVALESRASVIEVPARCSSLHFIPALDSQSHCRLLAVNPMETFIFGYEPTQKNWKSINSVPVFGNEMPTTEVCLLNDALIWGHDACVMIYPMSLHLRTDLDTTEKLVPLYHPDCLENVLGTGSIDFLEFILKSLSASIKEFAKQSYVHHVMTDDVEFIIRPAIRYLWLQEFLSSASNEPKCKNQYFGAGLVNTPKPLQQGNNNNCRAENLFRSEKKENTSRRIPTIALEILEWLKSESNNVPGIDDDGDSNARLIKLLSDLTCWESQVDALPYRTKGRLVGGMNCTYEQAACILFANYQSNVRHNIQTKRWSDLRNSKLPLWWHLEGTDQLNSIVESVARQEYVNSNKDPASCALFYIACDKVKIVGQLYKAGKQLKIADLLLQDFSELRWQQAAIKNAFVLKSKKRFQLAAAFFILGKQYMEAITICLSEDPTGMLSMLLARLLMAKDTTLLSSFLDTRMIPRSTQDGDVWLHFCCLWLLQRKLEAFKVLLETPRTHNLSLTEIFLVRDLLEQGIIVADFKQNKDIMEAAVQLYNHSMHAALDSGHDMLVAEIIMNSSPVWDAVKELRQSLSKPSVALVQYEALNHRARLSFTQKSTVVLADKVQSDCIGSLDSKADTSSDFEQQFEKVLDVAVSSTDLSVEDLDSYRLSLRNKAICYLVKDTAYEFAASVLDSASFWSMIDAISRIILMPRGRLNLSELKRLIKHLILWIAYATIISKSNMKENQEKIRVATAAVYCGICVLMLEFPINGCATYRLICLIFPHLYNIEARELMEDFVHCSCGVVFNTTSESRWNCEEITLSIHHRSLSRDLKYLFQSLSLFDATSEDQLQKCFNEKLSRVLIVSEMKDQIERIATIRHKSVSMLQQSWIVYSLHHMNARHSLLMEAVEYGYNEPDILELTCSVHNICSWSHVGYLFGMEVKLAKLRCRIVDAVIQYKRKATWGFINDPLNCTSPISSPSRKSSLKEVPDIASSHLGATSKLIYRVDAESVSTASTSNLENIRGICQNKVSSTKESIAFCIQKGIFRLSETGGDFQVQNNYAFFGSPVLGPVSSPGELVTASQNTSALKPSAMESHPSLPFFLVGSTKGTVTLWDFDYPDRCVRLTRRARELSEVRRIRFDTMGEHFGACDRSGLYLWKFCSEGTNAEYGHLQCHKHGTRDFAFLNSSSCLATVGSSSKHRNLCLWDTLMRPEKALVCAHQCHSGGATTVAFSSRHQLLISGGESGGLSVFDVRQQRVLQIVKEAHDSSITTMSLHPSQRCFITGSSTGEVKLWSLPIFREMAQFSNLHSRPSFLGETAANIKTLSTSLTSVPPVGVTDSFAKEDAFFTCGSDGRIQRIAVPTTSPGANY